MSPLPVSDCEHAVALCSSSDLLHFRRDSFSQTWPANIQNRIYVRLPQNDETVCKSQVKDGFVSSKLEPRNGHSEYTRLLSYTRKVQSISNRRLKGYSQSLTLRRRQGADEDIWA